MARQLFGLVLWGVRASKGLLSAAIRSRTNADFQDSYLLAKIGRAYSEPEAASHGTGPDDIDRWTVCRLWG
jgi:hypothetical protein